MLARSATFSLLSPLLYLAQSAVLASLLLACGAASHSPEAALHSYAQALRVGDVDRAYQLMSAEFRAQHSRDDFAQMLKNNQDEVEQTALRLSVEEGSLAIRAELRYGYDESVRLRKESGEWRLVDNPLAFYSQATPRDAVRSFLRAYSLKRWDVMLRFVPKAYRERMTVEMVQKQFDGPRKEAMSEMMESVRVNLNAPTLENQQGNEARLRYGERYEVELVREQGLWKIKRL